MSFEMDEDILQDFLIEAGEILELLSEQLVELEQRPDDSDLLNAIFRGFHTVKGGAGFLSLTELVDACHGAENVFDILRTGKRKVTSELMDTILETLDSVNVMFSAVQNGEKVEPAEQRLLDLLHHLSKPATEDEIAAATVDVELPVVDAVIPQEPVVESNIHDSVDDIIEDEFEKLLDELHGKGAAPSSTSSTPVPVTPAPATAAIAADGDITDDEFERLLDELHGSGKSPTNATTAPTPVTPTANTQSVDEVLAGDADLMSDDEFEKLLDQLHGSGKGPTDEELDQAVKPAAAIAPTTPVATRTQAPAPEVKPVAKTPAKPQSKSQAESTVRVDTSTLDNIMNMVGELVLVRNRLVSLGLNSNDEEMSKAVSNLDVVTADLQGAVMKTRMQPIKKVFGRFPRVVRDLARTLKKDIVLEMRGEETDLDKNLVEALADPLIHLVRNSVDHGIEMPEAREKLGKARTGKVILSASQEGDHILLSIIDDGGGMDADKLRSIAVTRGLMDTDAASRLTNKECYNLIFAPGFSTKTEISDISGRGVGMDVVKTAINQLNGSIDIDSSMGEGTKIVIKVPLTLAILPTLMVGVANQPFALPLASVNEIFHLDLSKTNIVDGQLTTIVREKSIPLFFLQDWLVKGSNQTERKGLGHVVIIQLGAQRVGFVVDTLIGQEEVVIKPLDELLQGTPGMAGATITSDGHIALILDVPNLLKRYAVRMC
ncbi:chemotaxis protein CheA [Aliivibrio sp. S3MY1]|uniref:chemotaxis protein CheA n=1 Tax=unclassified Aliivibrio TaxID=2645654 RepID=UPI0023786990|nr:MULTISPECIES: chemotaxis protein CheA [unclassified Aliivibrio]MDD9195545.1 chemotaxis protein CheA [Aliivibrio sp. S3MY1]MDD9198840.1 chemotaxis protein CheA [Aliivibrio sp. S2MY1]